MRDYRYVPHIRPRGEEKKVVHSWFNRFRKLLVRYEKTNRAYESLLQLAASIIIFRKLGII